MINLISTIVAFIVIFDLYETRQQFARAEVNRWLAEELEG